MCKRGFTMIELIFVIVILGVLASIAIPRLAATRDDAEITRARADISAIRSSIVTTRSQNLMSGDAAFPALEGEDANTLFEGVLDNPIIPGNGNSYGWTQGNNGYTLRVAQQDVVFTYDVNTGAFTCIAAGGTISNMCRMLLN